MSKARLVITAVAVEGRKQAEVARSYGVSPGWVSRLVARYREEGEGAFAPRSRRPKTSPTAISSTVVDRILQLRSELSSAGLDPHDRVRRDRIDDSGSITLRVHGRLHHIGIGRTHARTHVILLVHDLHVRVVDAVTGELLRDLIIDPTRDYHPTGAPRGPTRRKKS
jgi:hypothetical protein